MENNVPCKKIDCSQPEGSRKKGRPKIRWLEFVLKDLKTLEFNAWGKKAPGGDLLSEIIKETKAHEGLQRQRGRRNCQRRNVIWNVVEL